MQTVTAVTHDTLRQSNIRYDSIYLDNTVYVDRSGDTVFIRENHTQYKYKFLHDTIEVSSSKFQGESVKEVSCAKGCQSVKGCKIPPWCKWLSIIGALATIILIFIAYRKVATFV